MLQTEFIQTQQPLRKVH